MTIKEKQLTISSAIGTPKAPTKDKNPSSHRSTGHEGGREGNAEDETTDPLKMVFTESFSGSDTCQLAIPRLRRSS
jgi:hypothetical protein